MTEDKKIGYKRPPKEYQFKPGESGNKRGRPPKSHSFAHLVQKELKKKTKIKKGGVTKSISWLEVIIKTLVHKAIAGDNRAREMIKKHFPYVLAQVIYIEPKLGTKVLNETPLTLE